MTEQQIQKPSGTDDILPSQQRFWKYIQDKVSKRLESLSFSKIETPIFENKDIFLRSVGPSSDIVQKELFLVKGSSLGGEADLVLRPEATAGIVRAFVENGMFSWPLPVKFYYFGPMFRYNRPQAGRLREFWQFGAEVFGEDDPATDALVILVLWQIFTDLKLQNKVVLEINTLGDKNCQGKIKKTLSKYFDQYRQYLCPDCLQRLTLNPLRILDCKVQKCQTIVASAPQIVDLICDECKEHFKDILESLDDLQIPYDLNPKLVRGLDYYTRTTFEIRDKEDTGRQSALAGGGRYDNLVEQYSGRQVPAIGFAAGVERIIEKLKTYQLADPPSKKIDIFVIQLGPRARKKILPIISQLSSWNFNVNAALGKESLKSQLRTADRFGAGVALIMGQREAIDNTIIVRNMHDGGQETVDLNKLQKVILEHLKDINKKKVK